MKVQTYLEHPKSQAWLDINVQVGEHRELPHYRRGDLEVYRLPNMKMLPVRMAGHVLRSLNGRVG